MAFTTVSVPAARTAQLMHTLSDALRVPSSRLHSFIRLQDDLFLDPVDVQLLIAGLESKLEYYLTEQEMAQIETVGDIQNLFLR
ncbi:acyl carrier protein [Neolewinella antarctica]|uniref:Acyl carrier protein n=1 Tax=Neolewinella antarctica TaxID=442734 RepID=A0ABX0X7A2_9BACT|nr:acyl carrier protein [Neolewinella antarctica]NJC25119.1 acyl carrier protein [Neolewinella antarctica]